MDQNLLTEQEREIINLLSTPEKVQDYIDKNLRYNFEEDGETNRSFRRVLRDGKAHCLEGAIFAATVLYYHNNPPLVVCMEAKDMDHNIAIYKRNGKWGSVAQSRDENLKGRPPKYRRIRDLVMSYYPYYWNSYNRDRDITNLTMRGYALIDLRKIKGNWITAEEELDFVEDFLWGVTYRFLFPRRDKSKFYKVDKKTQKIIFL